MVACQHPNILWLAVCTMSRHVMIWAADIIAWSRYSEFRWGGRVAIRTFLNVVAACGRQQRHSNIHRPHSKAPPWLPSSAVDRPDLPFAVGGPYILRCMLQRSFWSAVLATEDTSRSTWSFVRNASELDQLTMYVMFRRCNDAFRLPPVMFISLYRNYRVVTSVSWFVCLISNPSEAGQCAQVPCATRRCAVDTSSRGSHDVRNSNITVKYASRCRVACGISEGW